MAYCIAFASMRLTQLLWKEAVPRKGELRRICQNQVCSVGRIFLVNTELNYPSSAIGWAAEDLDYIIYHRAWYH